MATFTKVALSGGSTGTPILVSATALTATITNATASAGTITYTATNTFSSGGGQIANITGIISASNTSGAPNAGWNLNNVAIASATGSNFTVSNAQTGGTYTSGGTVTANPSSMTTIHTTQANASVIDEVWLYATNNAASYVTLTIFLGGTATGSNRNVPITITLPPQSGETLIVPGFIYTSASAITLSAYATIADVVTISGYVNRIA